MDDHQHAHRDASKCVAIAPNVCLQPISHSSAPAGVVLGTPEAEAYGDHPSGFIIGHDRPGLDVRCEGFVSFDACGAVGERATWTKSGELEDGDLTLSPSILCKAPLLDWIEPEQKHRIRPDSECGFHGFVVAGAWVAA